MAEVSSAPVLDQPTQVNAGVAYRAPRLHSSERFDPEKHLCFEPPARRYTLAELGFDDVGISPVAHCEPFPLFTPAAVKAFREDILSDKVLDEYTVSSHLAARQSREYNDKVAPFTMSAWRHPAVTKAVSEAAGIELVPIMPLEYGNTNYMAGNGTIEALRNLPATPSAPYPEVPEDKRKELEEKNDISKSKQVVDWHHDSYPFVCVVMLSDASTMLGGETALRCGDGSIKKVRGPLMGWATVLQGRHVEHLACKAYNAYERITMVTSYRAKDASTRDASVLSTIRFISNKDNRLNTQWSIYRMKLLSERFSKFAEEMEEKQKSLAKDVDEWPLVIDKAGMEKFAEEQIAYLKTTYEEMM